MQGWRIQIGQPCLSAPFGVPASLVRRWYVPERAVTLGSSRSVYQQGRWLFHAELRRSPALDRMHDKRCARTGRLALSNGPV